MSITTTTTTTPATSVSIAPAADPADAHSIANMKGAGATADPLVHTRKMLRSCLGSGLRTAFACLIVGLTTVYGPTSLRRHLPFPAFAYVTAVLIAGEATTGDSLRGAVHALYGIMLSMLPTIPSLVTFGQRNFSVMTTTMAVVLGSFVVTLPESTSLITKRIALGHIVLVYVEVYKRGIVGGAVLHPGHAAASTSVGVVAAVLAVLLPYPRLARREVKEKSEKYTALAMEKMRLLLAAFCADDKICAVASISQAKSLSAAEAKLLHSIEVKQGAMQWERPRIKLSTTQERTPSDKLEVIRTPLKGMEMALSSVPSFPVRNLHQDLKDHLHNMEDQISLTLKEQNNQISKDMIEEEILPLGNVNMDTQNLPYLFFLFCIRRLYSEFKVTSLANSAQDKKVAPATGLFESASSGREEYDTMRKFPRAWTITISSEMVMVALKCSISTGLAVFLGLLFDKDNSQWSGLTVAMAVTPWREATFKLANLRAQGTSLGSVYGVLCSFLSENLMEFRFLALLPWIVFTSFLRRSQMYSHAGGITATVSAIIILGRKNYGPPTFFAMERLSETFIGLLCFILVEILLQPTRASMLARLRLSRSINQFNECIELILSRTSQRTSPKSLAELKEKAMKQIHELRKLTVEAKSEPNFWLLPFNAACYSKLQGSLTKMVELVSFLGQGLQLLEQGLHSNQLDWDMIQEAITINIEPLSFVGASTKCFENILRVKSLTKLDKELQRRTISDDVEAGETTSPHGHGVLNTNEDECDRILTSFLQHAENILDRTDDDSIESENLEKRQMVLCMGAMGYCIQGLMEETREMEKEVLELVQWENPSKHINLYEISCKIKNVPQF